MTKTRMTKFSLYSLMLGGNDKALKSRLREGQDREE